MTEFLTVGVPAWLFLLYGAFCYLVGVWAIKKYGTRKHK